MQRTCNVCSATITQGMKYFEEHALLHPNHYISGTGSHGYKLSEKNFYLPETDQWFESRKYLSRALKKIGMSNEAYFNLHGSAYMSAHRGELSKGQYGDAQLNPFCLECGGDTPFNEGKWHYPIFCGFSCSTKWQAENTDRIARAQTTLRDRKEVDADHGLRPNQLRYWTLRGLTDFEARAKVTERQSTNTLERFVTSYGEEEGTKRFIDRQERWFESMKASGMHSGFSQVSKTLFERLEQETAINLLYGANELSVRGPDTVYKLDCVCKATKRVIEFHGDYWHGNPEIYAPDAIINKRSKMSVSDKWDQDKKRLEALEEAGYKVLVVWEKEYKDNPDLVLGKCIGFMMG